MKMVAGKTVYTSDPWYDLCEGYIEPKNMLEDHEEAVRINAAVGLVKKFLQDAEEQGVLELS